MEKKTGKVYQKIYKLLLVLMLLTSGMLSTSNNVNANSYNVQTRFIGNWDLVALDGGGAWGDGTFFTVDGQVSWCLQANKGYEAGVNSPITPGDIGLSQEQLDRLALIAWYGYKSQPSDDNYVLTQNLIWQELGYLSYYKSSAYPNKATMQSWFNDVLNKVNTFGNKPSFNADSYTINLGETLKLEDTNEILNGLNIGNVKGASVTKNGNTLYVTPDATASDSLTITFNRGLSLEQMKTNFIVRKGNSQAVSPCLSGSDPYLAGFTVKVNKFGSLELAKQDNKGNYVPNTSFKLAYNKDMTDAIGTYTTLSNGKILVNDLLPTNK